MGNHETDHHRDGLRRPRNRFRRDGQPVDVRRDFAPPAAVLRELHGLLTRNRDRLFLLGMRDAEMTKYTANAMRSSRISIMNEIASLEAERKEGAEGGWTAGRGDFSAGSSAAVAASR